VDKRADIWAFGCVLFEMLTGRRAFTGDTASDTLASVLKVDPDWNTLPEDTPPKLNSLLRRCLNKKAKQRLHDIGDVRLELEELISGKTEIFSGAAVSAPRMSAAPEARWQRALPWSIAVVLSLALFLLGWNRWQARQTGLHEQIRFEIAPPGNENFAIPEYPMAVLSPNGKKLAFITSQGNAGNIYLRNLDDFEARPVTGVSDAHALFFSPDGKWVGFTSGGKMMKVSVDGGAPVPICETNWGGGTWGADGNIVFTQGTNTGLWRVSADGGRPEKITEPDISQGELGHWWPQILPGGEWVLFTNFGTPIEKAKIEALSLKTKEKRVLVEGAVYGKYAPTGHLLFFRGITLFAVSFDAAKLAVTGASVPVLEDVAYTSLSGFSPFSFSENGTAAYLTSSAVSRSQTLVWIDRKGKVTPVSGAPGAYYYPRLSPDGKHVAYASKKAGAPSDVWVQDLERGTRSRLTYGPATASVPVWTPDGKRIIYLSERPVFDLYWRAANESGPEEPLLTSRSDKIPTSVSPNGKWLLFQEDSAQTRGEDIYLLPLEDEHKPQAWRKTPFNERAAMYSPDGRWVAYSSNESSQNEVYVQASAGAGGRWQISTEGGFEPVWARNGRELFYRHGDEVMAVAINPGPEFKAGKPFAVFKERFERKEAPPNYDVSPDGQRFLIPLEDTRATAQARIRVVLNWFEELKRRVPPAKP
jgi:serine/threonine-protein kinase